MRAKNAHYELLLADRSDKLQKTEKDRDKLRRDVKKVEKELETLQFNNQRLHDDYVVQQQALDIYVQLTVPVVGASEAKAFTLAIDKVKIVTQLLLDSQYDREAC